MFLQVVVMFVSGSIFSVGYSLSECFWLQKRLAGFEPGIWGSLMFVVTCD
jgi:hypothetical protein